MWDVGVTCRGKVGLVAAASLVLLTSACRSDDTGVRRLSSIADSTRASGGAGGARRDGSGGSSTASGGAGGGSGGVASTGAGGARGVDAAVTTMLDADQSDVEVDGSDAGEDATHLGASETGAEVSGGPALPQVVVRASGMTVNTVRAKVVYAKTIDTYQAKIGRINRSRQENRWEAGVGQPYLNLQELVADEIYVKELNCRVLEADVVFTQEAKIQNP